MSGHPRLPLHVGDYLRDTPPMSRVSWEHHGIYLCTLMIAWSTPKCQLPNDPAWLAMRLGCTVEEYHEHVEPVIKSYFNCDGNFYRQKRLRQEHDYCSKQARAQSVRAKSRWKKEKSPCRGIRPAMPESQSGNAPTPTPTHILKKEHSNECSKESPAGEFDLTIPEKLDRTGFQLWWRLYPRKVGKRKAEAKYLGILRRREAVPEQLMIGLQRAVAYWNAAGKETEFIPHPTTWLSEGRWTDDYTTRTRASTFDVVKARAANGESDGDGGTNQADGPGKALDARPTALQPD